MSGVSVVIMKLQGSLQLHISGSTIILTSTKSARESVKNQLQKLRGSSKEGQKNVYFQEKT